MPTVCKIDVKKIDKALLFAGNKGTYLDIALIPNRDGKDQYGNLGFVVQSVSREDREAGKKGPILGNWRVVGEDKHPKHQPRSQGSPPASSDDIPF